MPSRHREQTQTSVQDLGVRSLDPGGSSQHAQYSILEGRGHTAGESRAGGGGTHEELDAWQRCWPRPMAWQGAGPKPTRLLRRSYCRHTHIGPPDVRQAYITAPITTDSPRRCASGGGWFCACGVACVSDCSMQAASRQHATEW